LYLFHINNDLEIVHLKTYQSFLSSGAIVSNRTTVTPFLKWNATNWGDSPCNILYVLYYLLWYVITFVSDIAIAVWIPGATSNPNWSTIGYIFGAWICIYGSQNQDNNYYTYVMRGGIESGTHSHAYSDWQL